MNRKIKKILSVFIAVCMGIAIIGVPSLFATEPPTFTITFNSHGGTAVAPAVTGTDGRLAGMPANPARGGHTFINWFSLASGGDLITTDTVFATNTDIHAQWAAITVTFDQNYIGKPADTLLTVGTNNRLASLPVAPVRTGYSFGGWFREGGAQVTSGNSGTIFNASETVTARWLPVITLDPRGGTLTAAQSTRVVDVNGRLTAALPNPGNAPDRTSLNFAGWFTAVDGGGSRVVTGTGADATIFATPTSIFAHWNVLVNFDRNGGTVTPASATTNVGGTVTLPVPTRGGFTFDGWFTAANGGTAAQEGATFNVNTTIFARWSEITVTFNPNASGAVVTPTTSVVGTNGRLSSLPTPSRPGYAFDRWTWAETGGNTVTTSTVFTENTTVFAQWSPIIVEFRANASGATVAPSAAEVDTNGRITTLPTPTRTGFVFNGWFTRATGGTAVTTETVFSQSTEIFAQWSQICEITFDQNYTGSPANTTATTGINGRLTTTALPVPAQRDGFAFNGWFTAASGGTAVALDTQFTADTIVFAQWSQIRTVTFEPNGGSVTPANALTGAGARLTLTELPTPTREGFTFAGWFTAATGGTAVNLDRQYTADTAIHARWSITVTLDQNYSGSPENTTSTVGANGRLSSLPTLTRTGFIFNGWFTMASGGIQVTTGTTFVVSSTIFAQWTPIHIVTFDPQGGAVPIITATADVNGRLTLTELPIPVRERSMFNGWFTAASGGTQVTIDTIYTANTTVFAQWTQIFTVTFDPQGGTGSPASEQTGVNGRLTLTDLPIPSRAGFAFDGWFTAASGGTLITLDRQYTADTIVYAQWSAPVAVVTFNPNISGAILFVTSAPVGSSGLLVSLPVPVRAGFSFDGWFTQASGGIAVTSATVFDSDITVFAQWTAITVTFNPNGSGGEVDPASAQVGTNGRLSRLPIPVRPGFIFDGWFTEPIGGEAVTTSRVYSQSTVIFAGWTAITVEFNPGSEAMITPTSATVGANGTLVSLPIPLRSGFAFNGWFTEEEGGVRVTDETPFYEDCTIYAQWSQVFAVTFDSLGIIEMTGENGRLTLEELPVPAREGFVFSGWFCEEGVEVTLDTSFEAHAIVYARWYQTYTVTFHPEDITATVDINGRLMLEELPALEKDGFLFNGWFTEEAGGFEVTVDTFFDEDTTLYAVWTQIFTVTFDVLSIQELTDINGRLTLQELPVVQREGLDFEGWFTEESGGFEVTIYSSYFQDTTVYARWSSTALVITFDPNISGVVLDSATAQAGVDRRLEYLPEPARTGFVFMGWFTLASGGDSVTTETVFDTDCVIFAQWAAVEVIFESNVTGIEPESVTVGANGRLSDLPVPQRLGFTFDGWFTEENGGVRITTDTVFEKNTVVFALWTVITVTFEPNSQDAMVTPTSATVSENGTLEILPAAIRADYAFNGWFTEEEGGVLVTEDTLFYENTTLYAQWSQIFTVTFVSPDGTVFVVTGANSRLTGLPVVQKEGFAFNGWFTEETGGTQISEDTAFQEDITVYAQWSEIFTVTFINQDDLVVVISTGVQGRLDLQELPVVQRDGFSFDGWFTEDGIEVNLDTSFESDTHVYASWTILPPRIPGDVTGTGSVDIHDALEILKYLAELPNEIDSNDDARAAATITGHGNPTICDALEILKYLAGLPNLLEPDSLILIEDEAEIKEEDEDEIEEDEVE
jgi:uncharacterized repeat protein (TIGR02543 family)